MNSVDELEFNDIINYLVGDKEEPFYRGTTEQSLENLLRRGVNINEISKIACENYVYSPSDLYYKADSKVRDILIERLYEANDKDLAFEILKSLAAIGDGKVKELFVTWIREEKTWGGENLNLRYISNTGGFDVNDKGEVFDLVYDKCFSFVENQDGKKDDTYIWELRGEICPHCGCEILDVIKIDGRNEMFSFLGVDGIIKASACPNCLVCNTIMNRFTLDGKNEILDHEFEGYNIYFEDNEFDYMIENNLVISNEERAPHYCGFYWSNKVNEKITIGGIAPWVFRPKYSTCPNCGEKMKFLVQIPWIAGVLYIEICTECKIISMHYDQS